MKKLCLIFLALVVVAGVALADPAPEPLPFSAGYNMVTSYQSVDGVWVEVNKLDPAKKVATYTSGGATGTCDKLAWTIDIVNHASVAQWIDWTFSDTRWDWQVRKPGTYAADCISFMIQSNNDVTMSFAGFEPLAGRYGTIPVWYGFGDSVNDVEAGLAMSWKAALGQAEASDNINNYELFLPYDAIKLGKTYKFWTKIQVDPATHSCEYEDAGVITLTLSEIKPWISAATGNFFTCNERGFSCNPPHFIAPDGYYYGW